MKKGRFTFLAILVFSLALFLSGCSSISPTNQSPNANFNASPTSGEAPLEVSFDGSNSSDPDGSIISYEWDFDDGSTGSGKTTTHTYSSSGNYSAKLTVTDDEGASSQADIVISVKEEPPCDYDHCVTAEELIEEFDENEVEADMKYEGTTVAITGKVDSISSPTFGSGAFVYLGEGLCNVQCEFSESNRGDAAKLSEGEIVTIVGEYSSVIICSPSFDNSYVE